MTADRDPRDVEARLRASLRAYADVADEDPGRPAEVRRNGQEGSSTGRRWLVPALVAAAVLAGTGGVLLVSDPRSAPDSVAAPAAGDAARSPEAASGVQPSAENDAAAAAAAGEVWAVPSPAQVGVEYPLDLYTHCGIRGADVGGVWFAVDPPLVDALGNPPAGWGNPHQRGTLTLRTADEAVFRDDLGHEVELRAAPESERPPPCA